MLTRHTTPIAQLAGDAPGIAVFPLWDSEKSLPLTKRSVLTQA